jgi:asparagine synthase (glutamine-hydrolysing)
MCGIAGFVGAGTLSDLQRMVQRLHYRGPDARGFWRDEHRHLFLGHARLAILDPAHGAQPMWTADQRLGVVFNGEIYNQFELRAELAKRGHVFRTRRSDTEVLLHGYREWGEHLPEHLNGMWAFAIYDAAAQTLFLSRDRFGKKPLFYTVQNRTFVFASELSALVLHPAVTARVAVRSLQKYFAYGFIPGPHALYERTHKLPAGHNLHVRLPDLQLRVRKYWDFVLEPDQHLPKHAEQNYAEQIRTLLERAVKRRLVADVPVGIFLSGGIDSASVAVYATRHHQGIASYSIGFREETFDESPYAVLMSRHLGSRHYLEYLSHERCRQLLPLICRRLDEPIADGSLVPTYLLCAAARKHTTVALGGDGADELFAGYDPFQALRLAQLYERLVPRRVHLAIRLLAARLPVVFKNMSLEFRLKRTLRGLSYPPRLWNPVWHGCLEPHEIEAVLGEPVQVDELYEDAIACWDACPSTSLVDKTLAFYTKMYLQDNILVKVDRASMLNSLEVRSPYLDIDLVDLVRRIPHRFKFRNGCTKHVLKLSLRGLVPGRIRHRKKKGFGMPIAQWLCDPTFPVPTARHGTNLSARMHAEYLAQHKRGACDHRIFLWGHYMFAAGDYGPRAPATELHYGAPQLVPAGSETADV